MNRVQKRDKTTGRFLSYDGSKGKKKYQYTRQDVISAFLAGQNDTGKCATPSQKLEKYLINNNL